MIANHKHFLASIVAFVFLTNTFGPLPISQADEFVLPQPGVRLALSSPYQPSLLVGMQVDPKNPFQLNFIFDPGQKTLSGPVKRDQYRQMVKYFLASLTIPNQDMWVNLSPYEKNRIIAGNFGKTLMGRDLLSEDYLLKQMTSSLIYPQEGIGREFWQEVYKKAKDQFGTSNIPVNTFNKVWIIPDKAEVYEKEGAVFIVSSHLKVMLEEDYLALQKHAHVHNATGSIGPNIIRQIVIPVLTKEVNEGKNFAMLRQIYSAMLMATWFKKRLRQSILGQTYADLSKTKGIDLKDTQAMERIYQEYLKAFKKGVFNFIQEENDPLTHETIPRKYFSGGMKSYDEAMIHTASAQAATDFAQGAAARHWEEAEVVLQRFSDTQVFPAIGDRQRFAGQNPRVFRAPDDFNEKDPELGWVPLTSKDLIVQFIPRAQLAKDFLNPTFENAVYTYRLPQDMTIQESMTLIENMRQKFSLDDLEKMALPQIVGKFNQLAVILKKKYEDSESKKIKVLLEGLHDLGAVLDKETADQVSAQGVEKELMEWLGLQGAVEDVDLDTMMGAITQKAVQGVQIELESTMYWLGERAFKQDLETNPEKSKWKFNEISALKGTNEGEIEIIHAVLNKVRALPGWNYQKKFQGILEESPGMEQLTTETNCMAKSVLMALYLKEFGFKDIWVGDVLTYQDKSNPGEHVVLFVRLSDGRYFQVEPSGWPERSHIIALSPQDLPNPKEGKVLKLTKTQDAVFKTIYVGDWRQLLTGMFYTSLGFALLRKGDKEGSIAAHRKSVTLYPSSIAYVDLGVALTENNNHQGAILAFRKAIELNPNNSVAWYNLGFVLGKEGKREEAIEAYQKAIELNPNYLDARYNLGLVLEKADAEGTIAQYIEVLKIDPNYEKANINLQIIFNQIRGGYARAIEFYREQVRLYPKNSEAHNNLGFF